MLIERNTVVVPVTIANNSGGAGCTAITFDNFAGGTLMQASGGSITTLTWLVSNDGVTYYPLSDGAGAAITTTIAAPGAAPIPVQCFAASFLKAYGNAAGKLLVVLKT